MSCSFSLRYVYIYLVDAIWRVRIGVVQEVQVVVAVGPLASVGMYTYIYGCRPKFICFAGFLLPDPDWLCITMYIIIILISHTQIQSQASVLELFVVLTGSGASKTAERVMLGRCGISRVQRKSLSSGTMAQRPTIDVQEHTTWEFWTVVQQVVSFLIFLFLF